MRARSSTFTLLTLGLVACGGHGTHALSDMASTGDLAIATRSLKFTVQPSGVRTGAAITAGVQVSVVNGAGTVDTTATDSITLALSANPGGATLGGTRSHAAVAGVATFADLTLDKAGTGYTLAASATGLASVTSMPFDDLRVLAFATPAMLAANSSPNSQAFASGRFHASGYDDFVASQNGTNNIIVHLSAGNGTFDAGNTFTTGNAPISVATGDIDGDGKIDVVVQCQTEVDVMTGDGTGAFTLHAFPTGNAGSVLAGIAVAKFTKSAKLDVVVADTSDNSVYLYANTSTSGTPSFSITHVVGPAALGFAKGIAVGDFNADGAPDFVVGDFTSTGTVVVWLNANTSAAATTFVLGGASSPALLSVNAVSQTVAAGDFNGDGKTDFFAPDDNPKNSGGIQNQGNVFIAKTGGFAAPTETNVGDDPFSAGVGDFDQDGLLDVAVASTFGLPFSGTSPSDLEILLGNGDGTFKTTQTFITLAGDNSARALAVGDYNGDGLPDVIIGSNPAWLFLNVSK